MNKQQSLFVKVFLAMGLLDIPKIS